MLQAQVHARDWKEARDREVLSYLCSHQRRSCNFSALSAPEDTSSYSPLQNARNCLHFCPALSCLSNHRNISVSRQHNNTANQGQLLSPKCLIQPPNSIVLHIVFSKFDPLSTLPRLSHSSLAPYTRLPFSPPNSVRTTEHFRTRSPGAT